MTEFYWKLVQPRNNCERGGGGRGVLSLNRHEMSLFFLSGIAENLISGLKKIIIQSLKTVTLCSQYTNYFIVYTYNIMLVV